MSTDLAILSDPTEIDRIADPAGYVIASCERAKVWLAHALEHGGIEDIVELKSQAEAIRVYTMQKQLGKDAELSASEIVRRAERGIGLAIRKGQETGEIGRRGSRGGVPPGARGRIDSAISLPKDYVSRAELSDNGAGIYQMTDDVPDELFETAITEAKAEGNLSRANVVRKVKGTTPAASDRPEILRKTRHLDNNRIIEQTVRAVEHIGMLLDEVDYSALDRDNLEEWVSSLSESIKALRSLKTTLEKELNHG